MRELGVISEAVAIQKMTQLPAKRLGLVDRGQLSVGYFADVVVYDPKTINDRATYVQSHQFSEGIDVVLVNGQAAWEGQARKDVLAGRVLRK